MTSLLLVDAIKDLYPFKKVTIIYGTTKDKAYVKTLPILSELSNTILLTRFAHERAASISSLMAVADDCFISTRSYKSVGHALRSIQDSVRRDSVVLVTGSLFLIAAAKQYLKGKSINGK